MSDDDALSDERVISVPCLGERTLMPAVSDCQNSTADGTESAPGDIVQQLHDWQHIVDESKGAAVVVMLSGRAFGDAAVEIEHLRADRDEWKAWALRAHDEIDRLRQQLDDARMRAEQDACEIERLRHNLTQLRSDNKRLADLYEGLYYATEEARRG